MMNDMNNQQQAKKYLFYRILGSIDNFIAILFLFAMLVNFATMGFNTMLLLPLFISVSILLYTNFAAVFARHVMVKGNYLRYKLKDWIKVNAYVTIIYAAFIFFAIGWALIEGEVLKTISKNMDIPLDIIYQFFYFVMFCMALLAIHVIMTFKYLKQFSSHFRLPGDSGNTL